MNSETAIAQFGSQVRGDHDRDSDSDLLIVTDLAEDRTALTAFHKRYGWSPSIYTWPYLESLAVQGSLFVKHLQGESRIFSDPNHRLADLLSSFRTRSNYESLYRDTATLFEYFEVIPDAPVARVAAMDMLYVTFRSLSVPFLADRGHFVFALDQILSLLISMGRLDDRGSDTLRCARSVKAAYRRGDFSGQVTRDQLLKAIEVVDRCFEFGGHTRVLPAGVARDELCSRLISDNKFTSWYTNMRACESAILTSAPALKLAADEFKASKTAQLMKIRNSQSYGWVENPEDDEWRSEFSKLMSISVPAA